MKLKLLAITALLAFAASASPVHCGSDLIANGVGTGPAIVCPTIGSAGFEVDLITLTIQSDYTGFEHGNPIVKIDYATGGPAGFTAIPTQNVFTIMGKNSLPAYVLSFSLFNPGPISGISVTPTSSVWGGMVAGSSSNVWIDYYQTAMAPEPATWVVCLLGGAVLMFAGRYRQRQ